jgi:hypothetical protein
VFDWTDPSLDDTMIKECDWKEYYHRAMEAIPEDNIVEK